MKGKGGGVPEVFRQPVSGFTCVPCVQHPYQLVVEEMAQVHHPALRNLLILLSPVLDAGEEPGFKSVAIAIGTF